MKRTTRALLIVTAVGSVSLGGFSAAAAAGTTAPGIDDGPNEASDSDTPLSGSTLDQASAAALEHTGGGEVTDTEIGDDGAAYGIEVRFDDGSQVEVNLDADFTVIGSHPDAD